MSRSGYSEECDTLWLYRQNVKRAVRGKRGKAFLQELLDSLDALPEKVLITDELIDSQGSVCALGAVGLARKMDMRPFDVECPEQLAQAFGIATCLVAEIEFENDEDFASSWVLGQTPEHRFTRMRAWVVRMLATGDPG